MGKQKKWPNPPKLKHHLIHHHYSMYKPYPHEGHSFNTMSYGNVFSLEFDSQGNHFNAMLVLEDIDLLIELLKDTKKLMLWQQKHFPEKKSRTVKKRREEF